MQNIYKPVHAEPASYSLPSRIAKAVHTVRTASAASVHSPTQELARAQDFIQRNSYTVLRQFTQNSDVDNLQFGLTQGWFSGDLCLKVLMQDQPTDLGIRLLLMRGAASASSAPSLSSRQTKESIPSKEHTTVPTLGSADSEEDFEGLVRRWNFRLAAQVPELRFILSDWKIIPSELCIPVGSDGRCLYIHPNLRSGADGTVYTFTSYLHTITHCLFHHNIVPMQAERELWNLACDIAAEYHKTAIFSRYFKLTELPALQDLMRRWGIPSPLPIPQVLHAGSVYHWLQQIRSQLAAVLDCDGDYSTWDIFLTELESQFCKDDHICWYQEHSPSVSTARVTADTTVPENLSNSNDNSTLHSPQAMNDSWSQAQAALSSGNSDHGSRRGTLPGSREEKMIIREQSQFDFRRYLRRFRSIREEMQLDLDSFDYIPYHYGMQIYGNMPMLEPLEYTEASRVEELVIAIDTSGSCDTATVQRFLSETHGILTRQENFFRKMQVHILQCDSMIHEHVIIHSTEEWLRYIKDIHIQGRGGTDFTPVFDYVEKLQAHGQLLHLKGLLYFTDGDGIYPRTATPYETAFVFSNEHFSNYPVPTWAVRLCLDTPEFYSSYTRSHR